uniref:Glyco_hydro_18 domain-containing protein n=1 Tax=Caenorhabditis japonica TaxID=281687 RepID=A0A8R1IBN9_CAEJA
MLARKSAPRLDYVSPVWFEAEVEVDGYRMPSGVTIRGQENINHDFIQAMKKANPATKIVPRIKFEYMPETFKDLVTNEVLIRRIGQTIVEFLKKFRLGGAVIEFLYSDLYTVENDSWLKLNYYESCQSIAKTFKNHNLTAILAIPPPIGAYIHSGETKWIPAMTSKECTLLLKDFDFVHFWTYNDFSHQGHRINIEQIRRTHELCRESKKVMIGLNFYGTQYSLNEHRAGKTGVGNGNTLMGKEYLKLLSDPSAKLEFNYENMEHELVLE